MMRRSVSILVSIALMGGTLWGCNPFRPQVRKIPQGRIPETFSFYSRTVKGPQQWWKAFGDPELNALIEEALAGSLTLKKAWARLRQAKALVVQAGADLYPHLSGSSQGSYGRRKTATETETGNQGAAPVDPITVKRQTTKEFSLGLTISYEVDLWGRIRSEREAERLTATATREDLNAAAITLASEVTTRWVSIISQRMQKRLLERQLQTNQTYLDLVGLRFRKAMASALDVYQQRQVVEGVKAQIPLVEAQEQLLLHELALLLGKPPRSRISITRTALVLPEAVPATGIPADLLANRPDIRAAWRRLQSADWRVSAARADRLPAIRLTAGASFGPAQPDLLWENWLLNLAANLAAPILDGNRRAAEVDRTKAVADERLWAYRETVLTAIKEVEDALVSEAKRREHIAALQLQIDAAKRALEEARDRYRKAIDDYLPVLTQLLAVQTLERNLIQQRAQLILDRLALYRALGGAWPKDLAPPSRVPKPSGT